MTPKKALKRLNEYRSMLRNSTFKAPDLIELSTFIQSYFGTNSMQEQVFNNLLQQIANNGNNDYTYLNDFIDGLIMVVTKGSLFKPKTNFVSNYTNVQICAGIIFIGGLLFPAGVYYNTLTQSLNLKEELKNTQDSLSFYRTFIRTSEKERKIDTSEKDTNSIKAP